MRAAEISSKAFLTPTALLHAIHAQPTPPRAKLLILNILPTHRAALREKRKRTPSHGQETMATALSLTHTHCGIIILFCYPHAFLYFSTLHILRMVSGTPLLAAWRAGRNGENSTLRPARHRHSINCFRAAREGVRVL